MILCQVNRILFKKNFINQFRRYTHVESSPTKIIYSLESRKLIRISGNDATVFLQGLITNDMRHFEEGAKSMYAMFLNNKGRVLYDTLIHKWDDKDSYMIECDKSIIGLLLRHLKLYKLKRVVEIEDVSQDYKISALILPPNDVPDTILDIKRKMNFFKDPRLVDLGFRVLMSASVNENQILETIGKDTVIESNEEKYKYLRYKLGISEGAMDLPPGSSFPLEVNCDYLHGVSFHKGCYIGQELTARVHHTGVIRKRIMPIKFNQSINEKLDKDSIILACDNPKSNLGKLKGYVDDYGIALIRIKEALEAEALNIGKYSIEIIKPSWWPIEAPKEKVSVDKIE